MSAFPAFVLGLLVGWIAEWIIDWIYWRRRAGSLQNDTSQLRDQLAKAEAHEAVLQRQMGEMEARDADLQRQLAEAEVLNADLQHPVAMPAPVAAGVPESLAGVEPGGEPAPGIADRFASVETAEQPAVEGVEAVPPKPDDLIIINGIGPVIAAKLNQAGITTFEQLAQMTPDQLRATVGDIISRLADEEDLIAQAKQFAAQKRARG